MTPWQGISGLTQARVWALGQNGSKKRRNPSALPNWGGRKVDAFLSEVWVTQDGDKTALALYVGTCSGNL